MKHFEDELKRALTRRQPSQDFAARVLAAARAEAEKGSANRWRDWFRVRRAPFWAFAPGAAMLLFITGGVAYQHHAQVLKGQHARHQLLLAMRITGEELQRARLHLQKVSLPEVAAQ